MARSTVQHTCFVIGRFWVQISAWRVAVLTRHFSVVFCSSTRKRSAHDCVLWHPFVFTIV